jgi:hypothetical protein
MNDEDREQFRRRMAEHWHSGWHGGPDRRDERSGEGHGS